MGLRHLCWLLNGVSWYRRLLQVGSTGGTLLRLTKVCGYHKAHDFSPPYRFAGGRQATTEEFLMGDRQMSVLPVTLSLLASFISAITLLGTPSEVFLNGTQV